jgi:hypothetical protein
MPAPPGPLWPDAPAADPAGAVPLHESTPLAAKRTSAPEVSRSLRLIFPRTLQLICGFMAD